MHLHFHFRFQAVDNITRDRWIYALVELVGRVSSSLKYICLHVERSHRKFVATK